MLVLGWWDGHAVGWLGCALEVWRWGWDGVGGAGDWEWGGCWDGCWCGCGLAGCAEHALGEVLDDV